MVIDGKMMRSEMRFFGRKLHSSCLRILTLCPIPSLGSLSLLFLLVFIFTHYLAPAVSHLSDPPSSPSWLWPGDRVLSLVLNPLKIQNKSSISPMAKRILTSENLLVLSRVEWGIGSWQHQLTLSEAYIFHLWIIYRTDVMMFFIIGSNNWKPTKAQFDFHKNLSG